MRERKAHCDIRHHFDNPTSMADMKMATKVEHKKTNNERKRYSIQMLLGVVRGPLERLMFLRVSGMCENCKYNTKGGKNVDAKHECRYLPTCILIHVWRFIEPLRDPKIGK